MLDKDSNRVVATGLPPVKIQQESSTATSIRKPWNVPSAIWITDTKWIYHYSEPNTNSNDKYCGIDPIMECFHFVIMNEGASIVVPNSAERSPINWAPLLPLHPIHSLFSLLWPHGSLEATARGYQRRAAAAMASPMLNASPLLQVPALLLSCSNVILHCCVLQVAAAAAGFFFLFSCTVPTSIIHGCTCTQG